MQSFGRKQAVGGCKELSGITFKNTPYMTLNISSGYDRMQELAAERIAELMAHIQV